MTVKERIIRRLENLDEGQLLEVEQKVNALDLSTPRGTARPKLSVEEEMRLWESLAGMLSDPEDYAAFEEAARRRPLFGGYTKRG